MSPQNWTQNGLLNEEARFADYAGPFKGKYNALIIIDA